MKAFLNVAQFKISNNVDDPGSEHFFLQPVFNEVDRVIDTTFLRQDLI